MRVSRLRRETSPVERTLWHPAGIVGRQGAGQMQHTGATRPQPRGSRLNRPQWGIAIGGFFVGAFALTVVLGMTSPEETSATVLGRVVAPVLLTSIATMILMRRSPLWFRALWLTGFVGATLGVSSLGLMARDRIHDERAFNDGIRETVDGLQRALDELNYRDGVPAARPKPTLKPEEGRYARALLVFRTAMWERVEDKRLYQQALQDCEWQRALEPTDLQKPDANALLKKRLACAGAAIDAWAARERTTTRDFVRDMAAAEMPADFRKGFEKGIARGEERSQFERSVASEREVLAVAGRQAELLISLRWEMDGETIMFHSERDKQAFDEAQRELRRAMRDNEALRRGGDAQLQQLRDRMRD